MLGGQIASKYKEAEVKEIIFLHAVAKVERNKAKEKQKAAKEAPAPSIYDTDSEESVILGT